MEKYNRLFITLCLLSVICCGFLFTGCQAPQSHSLLETSHFTAAETIASNSKAEIETQANESKITLYIATTYSPGVSIELNPDNYHLQSSQELSINFRFSKKTGEWKNETRTLMLGDTRYTASQTRSITYESISTQTPMMTPYRTLDAYTGTVDNIRFDFSYRQGTNELVWFYVTGDNAEWSQGDLTEDDAKDKADALISQLYTQNTVDQYNYETTTYDENSHCYDVRYARYVCGYKTEDQIVISFNRAGNVKSINALCMGYADILEAQVNEEKLSQAETALLNCATENKAISTGRLLLSADGKCYMSGGVFFDSTDLFGQPNTESMLLYILVE